MDKAESFAEWLFGDIFRCFIEVPNLEIGVPTQLEGERCVPETFFEEMLKFSEPFIQELMLEISNMPVLLIYYEDLFKRFTKSVCLRLINNVDPEVDFLKVVAFLSLITSMSFVNPCYRHIDYIPTILYKLLKDHLKTRFYENGRFDAITLRSEQLIAEERRESFVQEMRTFMNDAIRIELAATKIPEHLSKPDRIKIKIIDLRLTPALLNPGFNLCPYCYTKCNYTLKAFWEPKIKYKPDSEQKLLSKWRRENLSASTNPGECEK